MSKIWVRFINESEVERLPKNYKGIINGGTDANEEMLRKEGMLPLVEVSYPSDGKPYLLEYKKEKQEVIMTWKEYVPPVPNDEVLEENNVETNQEIVDDSNS